MHEYDTNNKTKKEKKMRKYRYLQIQEKINRKQRRRRKMGEGGDIFALVYAALALCGGFAWAWPISLWQWIVKLVEVVGVGLAGLGVPFVGRALKDGDKTAERKLAALRVIPMKVQQKALCDALEQLISSACAKLEQAGIPFHYERFDRAGRLSIEIEELSALVVVIDIELTQEAEILIHSQTSTSLKNTVLGKRLQNLRPAPYIATDNRAVIVTDFTEVGRQVFKEHLHALVDIVVESGV